LGCITVLIAPALLILLAITICGLPISFIGAFLLWIAWGLGVIVIGTETGKRFAEIVKADWALPVSAGVGTFLLVLVSNGIELVVPCIGWLVPALIGVVGLGSVLLTRFGSKSYPAEAELSSENELMLPASPDTSTDLVSNQDQNEPETGKD
jgi:hypothetical protein